MFMYSGITFMAITIMNLAIEGSRAARAGVEFTEGEDLLTARAAATAVATAAAAMADDNKRTIL
jgi:hypothetical protein